MTAKSSSGTHVVVDYGKQAEQNGIPVPDAGERHLLALDAEASFTWLRGSLVRRWLATHPEWLRAEGALGRSNTGLTGLDIERRGTLLRLPEVTLGGRLPVTDLGAFGTAPLLCDRLVGELFRETGGSATPWDRWRAGSARRCWTGYDLRSTIAALSRTGSASGPLLRPRSRRSGLRCSGVGGGGSYAIGGNVVRNGRPTADGIETGDRLIAVDRRHVAGLPSEEVMQALSASPGMLHWLTLERGDRIMKMNAP